ncbi:Nostrin, partial [Varanus komodoensis]
YDRAYQDLKGFSKNGDHFCKQLLSILQQRAAFQSKQREISEYVISSGYFFDRANLEITYSKGLEKMANKLTKVLDKMKVNYICSAWLCVSEGMKSASGLHRELGRAIQMEAISPTSRVLDEHAKRKKALDNAVEKAAEAVISNWRQQIKASCYSLLSQNCTDIIHSSLPL